MNISLRFPWKDLYHKWDPYTWTLYARIAVMGVIRRKDGTVAARFSDLLYPSYWPTFDQGGAKFIAWEKGTAGFSAAFPIEVSPTTALEGQLGYSGSELGDDTLALLFANGGFFFSVNPAGEIQLDKPAILAALDTSDPFWIPTRYETQVDVSPGEYHLQVVLSDGWEIGRAEMPLTIDPYDGEHLTLSSVALSRRMRDAAAAAKEAAAANFAPQYVPLVSKGMWYTPTGDTSFTKADPNVCLL